jgi:hypothetical protein
MTFGFMCDAHAALFFGLEVREEIYIRLSGTKEYRTVVYLNRYDSDSGVLPFPYNFVSAPRAITVTGVPSTPSVIQTEFCFSPDRAESQIRNLVSKLNLRKDDQDDVVDIMYGMLAPGNGFFYRVCENLVQYQAYLRRLETLSFRIEKIFLRVNGGSTSTVIPLTLLPEFYRAIFFALEYSNVTLSDRDFTSEPNLLFDYNDRKFKLIGNRQNFYLMRDEATNATPLLVDGVRFTDAYDLFQLPSSSGTKYINFKNMQRLCDPSTTTTST